MRIASLSRGVFAVTLVGLGIWGLIKGIFSPVWEPVPKSLPAREWLAYATSCTSLACGLGLLGRRFAALSARLLLALFLLWILVFRLRSIALAPASQDSWSSIGETAVLAAAVWVLYVQSASAWDNERLRFATGEPGLRAARWLYGFALIPFGIGHFSYLKETTALVPAWLPWHLAFAIFTGSAFILAGLAIITGCYARLAAALSTLQMGLFTVLVWLPIVALGHPGAFDWSEAILSWALTAAGWVVADSYREDWWLSRSARGGIR